MFHIKLSVVTSVSPLVIAALGFSLVLAGCSSTPVDPTTNWSPNKIYAEAKDESESGGYDKAISLFEKLEGRAAGTPLAQQAQLEKAYAQYKGGEQAQAVATLNRFIKLHPSSPALDYALYLRGLVNFNDNLGMFGNLISQDLAERGQGLAVHAGLHTFRGAGDVGACGRDLPARQQDLRRRRGHRQATRPILA